jgi:hypothetical protein
LVDLNGYFSKSHQGDILDEALIQKNFFEKSAGIGGTAASSAPTMFQLAIAYGIVHAKTVAAMSLEDFVADASAKLESMSNAQKALLWNAAFNVSGPKEI